LERVVDRGAAWYAATMMFASVFLLGALLALIAGATEAGISEYLLGAAGLIGAGLGYVAFHRVAEGIVFDSRNGAIEIPASRPFESLIDLVSIAKCRQLLRRERVALASIHGFSERDVALRDSRKRVAGYAYFLDLQGSFGVHTIHFRSDAKRREARTFIERRSRTAGVVPAPRS
jgi:hypothetical protein